MGQQNKLDIAENFTDDIEATIDDLFAPVKEIEIDPLTNEVKEKAAYGEGEAATSVSGPVLEDVSAHSGSEAAPESSEQLEVSEKDGKDDVLDLGLELEDVEFEPADSALEAEKDTELIVLEEETIESLEEPSGDGEQFEKFREAVMSLEWEITSETIESALAHAAKLKPTFSNDASISLLDSMILILEHMRKSPDDLPSASAGLIKGVDVLSKCLKGECGADDAAAVAGELSALISSGEKPKADEPEGGPESVIELEIEEEVSEGEVAADAVKVGEEGQDVEVEIELELDEPQEVHPEVEAAKGHEEARVEEPQKEDVDDVSAPSGESGTEHDEEEVEAPQDVKKSKEEGSEETLRSGFEVKPSEDDKKEEKAASVSSAAVAAATPVMEKAHEGVYAEEGASKDYDILREAVERHLSELEKITAKIMPVEKVLSGTKGMEKLHAFQKAVRTSLETQKKQLMAVLGGEVPSRASSDKSASEVPVSSQKPVHEQVASCPYEKLVLIEFGNGKIAVPPEAIAFSGPLSGKCKKKVRNGENFALSWLKTWPWVKIKPSLSGPLAEKGEKELKAMTLPVINSRVAKATGVEDFTAGIKKPSAVIIFGSKGKGSVIYLEGEPVISEEMMIEEWTGAGRTDDSIAGTAIIGDETVPVIDA